MENEITSNHRHFGEPRIDYWNLDGDLDVQSSRVSVKMGNEEEETSYVQYYLMNLTNKQLQIIPLYPHLARIKVDGELPQFNLLDHNGRSIGLNDMTLTMSVIEQIK